MGIYTYQSGLIDQITFKESEGGQTRAYLHAAEGSDPKTLFDISCKLAKQGWQVTPYNMGGKPMLEVLGFGKEAKLLSVLNTNGWVEGKPQHQKDTKHQLSFAEQVKKRSLAASGAFYLVGDYAFTRYGYKGASKLDMGAGMMYGAGTLSLLGFGRKDQTDLQVRDIAKKLDAYLKEKGDDLPESCSLESITKDHKKGLIRNADDLFRRYPSEMMNIFFAVAGTLIAISAHKKMHFTPTNAEEIAKHEKSVLEVLSRKQKVEPSIDKAQVEKKMHKFHILENKLDIGLGGMTGLSGLFAASVKEKAPDPDAPKKHGMAKAWEFVQQKPLAIAGVGYFVSTMCHAASTTMAWRWSDNEHRSTVKWRATFVAANILAEILLAISSKGHGHGVKSDGNVDNTIISLASDMIIKHPQAEQEELIDHVARFLGRRDVLAVKDNVVRQQLHTQVEAMRKNPWAVHGAKEQSALADDAKAQKPEDWQARVSQPAPGQPQLSS